MDFHRRNVGILHIICGALVTGTILFAALIFGFAFGAAKSGGSSLLGFIAGLGAIFFVAFLLVALAQVIAGIKFLQGSRVAGNFLIVFGVLSLFNFPFGTAVGAYTLWVLLIRKSSTAPAV